MTDANVAIISHDNSDRSKLNFPRIILSYTILGGG